MPDEEFYISMDLNTYEVGLYSANDCSIISMFQFDIPPGNYDPLVEKDQCESLVDWLTIKGYRFADDDVPYGYSSVYDCLHMSTIAVVPVD